jgi:nucleoside 2-deoxyribosyltransferase
VTGLLALTLPGVPSVYLAGPLGFSPITKAWHDGTLVPAVRAAGFEPLDPWADPDAEAQFAAADAVADREARRAAFAAVNARLAAANEAMLRRADAVLAVLDGVDVDSGTAAEIGFAAALGIPCVGLRTDVRQAGDNEGTTVNLQVEHWLVAVTTDLDAALVLLRHAAGDDRAARPSGGVRG